MSDTLKMRTHPLNGDPDVFQDLPIDALPYSLNETMKDEKDRNLFFAPCFHECTKWSDSGFFPDFGEANKERISAYTTIDLLSPDKVLHVPIRHILNFTPSRFPEFYAPCDWRPVIKALEYKKWSREEIKKPKATISGGFSLINFLAELGQSKALVKSWISKRSLIERWHKLFGANRSLPERARAAANERLAHVYGTKLLIRDAQQLFRVLTNWKRRADKFLSDAGTIKRWYKPPFESAVDQMALVRRMPLSLFGAPDTFLEYRRRFEVQFHAVLYYSYEVKLIKGFLSRLSQLGDAYGIHLDAGIIWDAIPLSFIVDWFINVSEWLHANVSFGDWNKSVITAHTYGHSFRILEYRELWFIRNIGFEGTGVPTATTIAFATSEVYRRIAEEAPAFRKTLFEFSEKGWSIDRVINATALGIQRLNFAEKKRKLHFIP